MCSRRSIQKQQKSELFSMNLFTETEQLGVRGMNKKTGNFIELYCSISIVSLNVNSPVIDVLSNIHGVCV